MAEPYLPVYCRKGNTILREWTAPFDDGHGHTAIACWVSFRDKTGNVHDMLKWIKWDVKV